jgi:hypothetical protein
MAGARVIGVVLGTAEQPMVSYLEHAIPIDEVDVDIDPEMVTQVFRIAAHCEGEACAHFDNDSCTLAERISNDVPGVVEMLPRCTIRRECRWYAERGAAACRRCPQVITLDRARPGNTELAGAARPR